MILRNKIILFLLMNFIFMGRIYSQYSQNLISVKKQIDSGRADKGLNALKKLNPENYTVTNKAFYYYLKGVAQNKSNQDDSAYSYYIKAKNLYLKADSTKKAMDINLDIAYLISAHTNTVTDYKPYIDEYLNYAGQSSDSDKAAQAYINAAGIYLEKENYTESLRFFQKARRMLKNSKSKKTLALIYNNLAVLFNENLNEPDSALYYLEKQVKIVKQSGDVQNLCYNYINQAAAYHYKGNYTKAIAFLKKADSLPINDYTLRTRQIIYEIMAVNFDSIQDFKNAYRYTQKAKVLADSLNITEQNIALKDIQTKYQTKEKELENKVLKSKINTNRILLYTFIGLLIASLALGFLIIKNARRRQKIALQEKLIEKQQLEKALKDYELSSIDMILEGQEKERQRIANDLHDNLGSMLATLKLNFENLRLRKKELREEENKLYDRTDQLIEEAYQKVRNMAHAKNAGVFASEGLIPAVKKLAERLSIPGKLKFDVVTYGFNDRLENTLEIAVFRIIQELATNIIKHAQATEANIQLTKHDDIINILTEDNGIGFDIEKTDNTDGMGLQNIRKKTEQLKGTFNIDSTPGKGTTIIIDIPV